MANRIPLIVDTTDSNKIKELPSGDNLQLTGNDIIGVVNVTGSGTLTITNINATNITKGGTSLAAVATTGSYTDLDDTPVNISHFTNDSNYLAQGSNISLLLNNAGYLTSVAFADVTSKPTTLAGYGITDAATATQGARADGAVLRGDDISTLNNDAGYITLTQVQNGDLTVDVKNSGDLVGSVFGQDSTVLVDAILSSINTTGTIRGHTTPHVNGVYDLGATDKQFRNAYVSGTINGNTTGYHTGDVNGSVFADDSTLLVDGVGGTITGTISSINWMAASDSYLTISNGGSTGPGPIQIVASANLNLSAGAGQVINANRNIVAAEGVTGNVTGDVIGSVFADDSTLLVDGVNGEIPGYVKIADLKTALQDGAGDYAAFKAWVLANL